MGDSIIIATAGSCDSDMCWMDDIPPPIFSSNGQIILPRRVVSAGHLRIFEPWM